MHILCTSHHQSSWKVNLINLFNWKLGGLQKEWRKISWKLLVLGFFLVICQTGWRILLFLDCFFTFIWPLKVIKTLFTYFNHQIKSITSLNCNMSLIQFVIFERWYCSVLVCHVVWVIGFESGLKKIEFIRRY